MNDHAILSLEESQLLAVSRWHHEAANAAGREGATVECQRHIAIRDQLRSKVYG